MARRLMILAVVMAVTTVAYLLLEYWTPVPMQLSGSFLGGAENDTRTIKEVWPLRIIQPSWLRQTDNLFWRWEMAEMRAREIAVAVLWLSVVTLVILRNPSQSNEQT